MGTVKETQEGNNNEKVLTRIGTITASDEVLDWKMRLDTMKQGFV